MNEHMKNIAQMRDTLMQLAGYTSNILLAIKADSISETRKHLKTLTDMAYLDDVFGFESDVIEQIEYDVKELLADEREDEDE